MPPFAIIDLHGIQHFFSVFLRGPKSGNFRIFCDFLGPEKSRFFGLRTALRTDLPNLPKVDFLAIWLVLSLRRMVLAKVPKIAKISIFPDFSDFSTFCGFLRFFRILLIFQDSTGFPETVNFPDICQKVWFWTAQNLTFEVSNFRTFWTSVSTCGMRHETAYVGCYMCYFSEFFASKKIGKIYLFGLNHLSNCWLVYAVGSLRPDSYPYVRRTW